MYVRNAWYVACTAEEIGHGKPLGRTVCGERMVLFRGRGRRRRRSKTSARIAARRSRWARCARTGTWSAAITAW